MFYSEFFLVSLAPNISVIVTPPLINGNATGTPINITYMDTVEESITLDEYEFVWMFNGIPIDQCDGEINV